MTKNEKIYLFKGNGFLINKGGNWLEGIAAYISSGSIAIYSLDDVSDGAPNFCIEHWDLANEKIELEFSRIEKGFVARMT